MVRTGFRRGTELMPWPDGLEYAASAVDIDHGFGPVLHFGGHLYPSRYTKGYPLILAAAYPVLGRRVERLCLVTVAAGLLAVVALYGVVLRAFGRTSAFLAGLMLGASPLFITYSTLVLSDVPTLTVTILAGYALLYVGESEEMTTSAPVLGAALFGLLAGLGVIIRPTNAAILAGLAAALVATPPPAIAANWRSRRTGAFAAFAASFMIFPLWQAWENIRDLGALFRSGYAFWVPGIYGSLAKTFGARFLFGPTMPRNPHGNVVFYGLALLGLDGMLGDRGDPYYFLYPFATAAFAVVGIAAALINSNISPAARRLVWFGLAFLAALLVVYLPYFFTDAAFILPGTFVVFAAGGYGIVVTNRDMRTLVKARLNTGRALVLAPTVFALDLLLCAALVLQTVRRLDAPPQAQSKMVASLGSLRKHLPPDATVVSNISLQFLELYLPAHERKFVGLNPFDPGERFTDYHLHRLYLKRARGWQGPLPPVLFAGEQIDQEVARALVRKARTGRPLYLLLSAPESPDYAATLRQEFAELSRFFTLEAVARNESVAFYHLLPRADAPIQNHGGTVHSPAAAVSGGPP